MENTIQLPDGVTAVNPNPESEGIKLPFTAPVLWWVNGKKDLKELGGVKYFGGWAGSDDDIELAVNEYGPLPDGFVLETHNGRSGEYAVYSKRNIITVIIKTRTRWLTGDNGKARSHSQTLALLGKKNDQGQFVSWGPVVLSAKGYITDRLKKSMDEWQRHTAKIRSEVAPGVPSWYFWSSFGTFGERNGEMVGGGQNTSEITPPMAYCPEMSADLLRNLYVGGETAKMISDLAEQAREWATDKRWIKGKEAEDDEESLSIANRPMTDAELDAALNFEEEDPFQ